MSKAKTKESKKVAKVITDLPTQSPGYDELLVENAELKEKLSRFVEMDLQFSPVIEGPPVTKKQMYAQACSGDSITVASWLEVWLSHIEQNTKNYDMSGNSVMLEYDKNKFKPAIIAGSGPSLKKNVNVLKEKRNGMCLVSCLHNYGFFEENGITPNYYLNLDAGDITISEVSQGGGMSEEECWASTKDKTLLAVTVTNPKLLEKWQGRILWFNTVNTDPGYNAKVHSLTDLRCYFNNGGNALGACLYMAKAVLGSNPIAFVGADFCFSYTKKFHPFDSPYDQQFTGVIPAVDVYGNRVATWPSYMNFKVWFDFMACGGHGNTPGQYINCTEGGILGAYQEGNIKQIRQMTLNDFLGGYNLNNILPELVKDDKQMSFLF